MFPRNCQDFPERAVVNKHRSAYSHYDCNRAGARVRVSSGLRTLSCLKVTHGCKSPLCSHRLGPEAFGRSGWHSRLSADGFRKGVQACEGNQAWLGAGIGCFRTPRRPRAKSYFTGSSGSNARSRSVTSLASRQLGCLTPVRKAFKQLSLETYPSPVACCQRARPC